MPKPIPQGIDRSAPIVADHRIAIRASLERVWQLHTAVSAWPTWQADIADASLPSPLEPGVSFHWTTYGMAITSTVYALEPARRILWGGTAADILGIHEWLFRETPDGVEVRTLESFAGAAVAADVRGMQTLLDRSLVDWLERLKVAAEGDGGAHEMRSCRGEQDGPSRQ